MKAIKSDSDNDSDEQKKVASFFSGKNRGVTPLVAAPGVTHPSDATEFGLFSGHSVHPALLVLLSYNIGSFVKKHTLVLLHLLYRLEIVLHCCLYVSDSTHTETRNVHENNDNAPPRSHCADFTCCMIKGLLHRRSIR